MFLYVKAKLAALLTIWVISLSCFFSICALSWANTKQLTTYDLDWPPFFFSDATNSDLNGLGKDVLNICAAEQDYRVNYIPLPIKRISLYMQNGEIDLSIYSYKKHREAYLKYGKQPVFNAEVGFVVRADSDININSLEDLTPLRIGHLSGLTHTPEILAIINHKRLVDELSEGHNIDAMFAQLLSATPRFDIMPDNKQTFYWRAKQLGISDKVKILPFVAGNKDYFISISKKSRNIKNIDTFLSEFDKCILQLHQKGQYTELADKYSLQNMPAKIDQGTP